MPDTPRPDGPYRTPASLDPCLGCPSLEAAALTAYLGATAAQGAEANEILACDACGRTCGVRVWVGARSRRLATAIERLDAALGEWATVLPEGARAPGPVVALMAEKEMLEAELRGVWTFASAAMAPSRYAAGVEPALSVWGRLLGWLGVHAEPCVTTAPRVQSIHAADQPVGSDRS